MMSHTPNTKPVIARRIRVRGVVQGVGFRPFIYRLAGECGVCGWVLNGPAGVEIHAEADAAALEEFRQRIENRSPPAARIAAVDVFDSRPEGHRDFEIRASSESATPTVRISADLPLCEDCRRELFDPSDPRFQYPYINCTHCGPRYSLIEGLPYDRDRTTMRDWPMCPRCAVQYADPGDRRFHAQPLACPQCGPDYELVYLGRAEPAAVGRPAIREAAAMLRAGYILAVKGIGGYHLACDACNATTVETLRLRKFRKERPLALMASSLDRAAVLVHMGPVHEALLLARERPIVLADARKPLSGIAPDNPTLGVMLPYAPLHDLLFSAGAPDPLVLTSGNRSSEPIAYRDEDARERLGGLADALLLGQRRIARRVDDSIAAVRRGQPVVFRRSRGYAPACVATLPTTAPVLALGADLKNAITLVVQGEAYVSQHIGDLGTLECNRALQETIGDLLAMYQVDPERLVVAHDRHPEFVSTRLAQQVQGARRLAIQHHCAHVASVAAEHGLLEEPLIGVALDGAGLGLDGAIWGCELLCGTVRNGFTRRAWMRPALLPGGDAAARFPVQAAAGFLHETPHLPDLMEPPFSFPNRYLKASRLIAAGVRCFPTTSMGRLFDAAAALLGFVRECSFEGQAAMWLEGLARGAPETTPYAFEGLDYRPLLQALAMDRKRGRPAGEIARAFHVGVAHGLADAVVRLRDETGIRQVALSGGVCQNELIVDGLCDRLEAAGQRVWINRAVPANDGGISLGQAALAVFADASR